MEPKNVAIPAYSGFIPGLVSENKFANTYSHITRECFANPELGKNKLGLSSAGFNFKRYDFEDSSKSASTHKYGNQTLIKNHPCLEVFLFISGKNKNFTV